MTIADLGYEVRDSWKPDDNNDEILPYLGLGSVPEDDLHIEEVDSSSVVKSNKYKFKKGDILFGTLRPYFRKLVIASFDGICSTEFSVIRPHNDYDREYLFYALAQNEFIDYATTNSTGARPRTKWKLYSDFELNNTDKDQRVRIGEILSQYDRLINLNRKQIKLLEKSAKVLYEEWFINFQYPGSEKASNVNGLPKGWERRKIEDVTDTVGGGTPSTKVDEYWEGDITWFVPSDLTQTNSLILLDSDRKISERGLNKSSAKMLPPETILMTSRASVGYFGLYEERACTNQGFISIIPELENFRMYLLYNLMSRVREIQSLAGGSTYKEINKTTFRNMDIIVPQVDLLKKFEKYTCEFLKQVRIIKKQNEKLKQARDLLLPRLMNGDIPV